MEHFIFQTVSSLWIFFGIFATLNYVVGSYIFTLTNVNPLCSFYEHLKTFIQVFTPIGFLALCVMLFVLGPIGLYLSIRILKEAAKEYTDESNKN